jgi:hypothetical protein
MIVYVWKHKDGTPFYVGMTKNYGRADPTKSGGRGWLCKQALAEVGAKNVVVELHQTETTEDAAALEQKLIAQYGRIQTGSGPLTNLKTGGDGWQGMSDEGKARLSAFMKANNPMHDPEIRARATVSMNRPEVKEKYSGDKNPAKRPEVRAKLLARWQDPEYRERQRIARTGKKRKKDI